MQDTTDATLAAFARFKHQFQNQPNQRKQQLKQFVLENFGDKEISVLDVGGGKFPLFSPEEIPSTWHYTVNDISDHELAQLPPSYVTLHADICGELTEHHGKFDLVLSCMLAEHIKNSQRFYANQFRLLKDGGAGLHLHPTLFSLPFTINWLAPEALAKRMVETLKPQRKIKQSVFPAFYDWCTALSREKRRRMDVGFSHVDAAISYHHHYYRSIPGLSQVAKLLGDVYRALDFRPFAAFAVYLVIK